MKKASWNQRTLQNGRALSPGGARSFVLSLATFSLSLLLIGVLLTLLTPEDAGAAADTMVDINAANTGAVDVQASLDADRASDICVGGLGIPASECEALVDLYDATKGDAWLDKTHWLIVSETVSPCDWAGIACADGHVTALDLSGNGLAGALPASLSDLEFLNRISIDRNAIGGTIGPSVCGLVGSIQQADLDYNRLSASGNRSLGCLDEIDPGWSDTQTVAPTDLGVEAIESNALVLRWTPIDYVEDGGAYAIGVATSLDGPYTMHGQTADKQASTYRIDGLEPGRTYYLRVRSYTPAHDDQPNDLWSGNAFWTATTDSPKSVLLAVYFGADNDLDSYARIVQQRLVRGTLNNPNVTVVALIDRLGDENTQVWTIADGAALVDSGFLSGLGENEVDTSDPAVLSAFLIYARSVVQADVSVVSIIGHGVGLTPELTDFVDNGGDLSAASADQEIPALPRPKDSTPTDVTNGSYMSTPELGRALAAATEDGANPFDLIFFDQCFGGSLDVLYEVRSAAKVFVASPNYAWLAAPYARYLAEFSPERTPEQLAGSIIDIYQRSLNDRHPNAILAVRGVDVTTVAGVVDSLAARLIAAIDGGDAAKIHAASINSDFADTTQCGAGNLSLGPPDEMIGAGTFAANLQQAFGPGDTYGVHGAAGDLIRALDEIRSTHRIGSPYLEPEEFWDYGDTITLLAPLERTTRPDIAWRASIYGELEGQSATWTPLPEVSATLGSPFAYVVDGEWDAFIERWYTGAMTPTVGQWCNYAPPALVISDTVESMTLLVEVNEPEEVRLTWSAVPDAASGDYLVHARQPGDINWTQVVSLPATETAYDFAVTGGELYRFIVVATDVAGTIIAKSDSVDWQGEGGTHQLYLPVVRR